MILDKKERRRQYHIVYYAKNREKLIAYTKEYNRLHNEKRKHDAKEWRTKNRARIIVKLAEWRARNKDRIKAYSKFYFRNNKEQCRASSRARRKRGEAAGKLTRQTVQMVYEDNIKKYGTLTCYLCLKPIVLGNDHLEHKTPICRGGTNEYNNLAVAHALCNLIKHDKTEVEFKNSERL